MSEPIFQKEGCMEVYFLVHLRYLFAILSTTGKKIPNLLFLSSKASYGRSLIILIFAPFSILLYDNNTLLYTFNEM